MRGERIDNVGDGEAEGGDPVGVHVIFSGMVQGVFFRANTRREARRLGLKGWVRNLPDGTVEAWIEGDRSVIDQLFGFCRTEIPIARVDRVAIEDGPYTGDFPSFEVVR